MKTRAPSARKSSQRKGKSGPRLGARSIRALDWRVIALLLGVTIVVYFPTLFAGFLKWDDNLNVTRNPAFNPPTVAKVARYWTEPYLDLYVPLTYSIWGLLAALGWRSTPNADGDLISALPFHLTNLGLHLVSTLVVFALLRRLIGKPWAAGIGAALFAIHPLQVEPVAWVTGMKDLLGGCLSLICIWQYVTFADERDATRSKRRWVHYAAAFVAFVLAILAKPSAVVAPLMAMVIDRWVLNRSWNKVLWAVAPLVALGMCAGLATVGMVQTVIAPADGGRHWARSLIAADAMAFYIYKLVAPIWLGFHYDRSPMAILRSGAIYWTWTIPACLVLAADWLKQRVPMLMPSLLLFFIGAATTLGLTPFAFQRFSTVADRYVYLSMLGPALLAAWCFESIESRGQSDGRLYRRSTVIAGAILALFAVRSFVQTFVWHDDHRFFENALRVNPRSFAANDGIAGLLTVAGKYAQAEPFAMKATELAPDLPDGYIVLGTAYGDDGQLEKAKAEFERAVAVAPASLEALDGLAATLARMGQLKEAERMARRALRVNPQSSSAREHLAQLLFETHRYQESFDEANLAVQFDPTNATAELLLARLALGRHDRAAAIQHLAIVLTLHPNDRFARRLYEQLTAPRPAATPP